MKRPKIFFAVLSFVLFLPALSFSLVPYDDFSGTYIDKSKWREAEFVREIDLANQRLLMKHASASPAVISAYPYWDANSLSFVDPNSVNSMQTDVTIPEANISNQGETWARLSGVWYYDGTAGGGMIGNIVGEVFLRKDSTGLYAAWEVVKLTNTSGSVGSTLGYGKFTTPISTGTTYTLYINYDAGVNQFTFRVGGEEKTFGPSGLPTPAGNATAPGKLLGTRVDVPNSASSGYISATFDNVYKNGDPYEDFSSLVIDQTKWGDYEYVREISGGKLRSEVRSSTASTSGVYCRTEFINPSSINVIQTKVTPMKYQNEQGGVVSARIGGLFYNDGTPGGGFLGDVGAEVYIGGTVATPIAGWTVWTFSDSAGANSVLITSGTFTTPITLGNTYTLLLGWDGSQFTFEIDNESASYTPVTSINPPHIQSKEITTRIRDLTGKEATIEAFFDDVMVNGRPGIVDFDGDGKSDITIWRPADGYWYTISSKDGSILSQQWGAGYAPYNDVLVPGDYDGDGKTDIAIWRPADGYWYIISSKDGSITTQQWGSGALGDVPVPGDYDGDGKTDIAVWRPGDGFWYIINSKDGGIKSQQWGTLGDIPVPGDYDGDGKTDIAVWRPTDGYWYIINSRDGSIKSQQWGSGALNDVPVPGDYDGDGKTDIAVWRPGDGYWYIISSKDGSIISTQWGSSALNDVPVPGDYDGDGKTDIAIWRPGYGFWYIINSKDGSITSTQWGAGSLNDEPISQ